MLQEAEYAGFLMQKIGSVQARRFGSADTCLRVLDSTLGHNSWRCITFEDWLATLCSSVDVNDFPFVKTKVISLIEQRLPNKSVEQLQMLSVQIVKILPLLPSLQRDLAIENFKRVCLSQIEQRVGNAISIEYYFIIAKLSDSLTPKLLTHLKTQLEGVLMEGEVLNRQQFPPEKS